MYDTNNSDCFYYAHFGLSYNYRVSSYEILDIAKNLVCDAETIDFIDGVSLFRNESMKFVFEFWSITDASE